MSTRDKLRPHLEEFHKQYQLLRGEWVAKTATTSPTFEQILTTIRDVASAALVVLEYGKREGAYAIKITTDEREGMLYGPTPNIQEVLEFHPAADLRQAGSSASAWIVRCGDTNTPLFQWINKVGWRAIPGSKFAVD